MPTDPAVLAETNRTAVLAAWKSFATRDTAKIAAHFAPDAVWIAPEGNATAVALGAPSGFGSAGAIARFVAHDFGRLFARDVVTDVTRIVAEGDAVVLELRLRATLCNGRLYDNDYCFVFIVRGGLITAMREFMDTAKGFRAIFGDDAPGPIARAEAAALE
jgi:ketosteroid isomerase-like protein